MRGGGGSCVSEREAHREARVGEDKGEERGGVGRVRRWEGSRV